MVSRPLSTPSVPQPLQRPDECLRLLHGPLLTPWTEQAHLPVLALELPEISLLPPIEDARYRSAPALAQKGRRGRCRAGTR